MSNMMAKRDYDLTEITRLLLKMRDNCQNGDAYDDPERKEKYAALNDAIDLINNPSRLVNGDLISREALMDEISAALLNATFTSVRAREQHEEKIQWALDLVGNAPTVDAAPVVRSRWIEHENDYDGELECAHCHARFDGEIWYMQMKYRGWPKHCPNCGAKMDKEEEA